MGSFISPQSHTNEHTDKILDLILLPIVSNFFLWSWLQVNTTTIKLQLTGKSHLIYNSVSL